jgi:hypothetical protein
VLERLQAALARHTHITFTDWHTTHKNPATPHHRAIITVCISEEDQAPDADHPFVILIMSINDTGIFRYLMTKNKSIAKAATVIPLDAFTQIDPINQPNDVAGFTADVLGVIRTTIAPLPPKASTKKSGYFI